MVFGIIKALEFFFGSHTIVSILIVHLFTSSLFVRKNNTIELNNAYTVKNDEVDKCVINMFIVMCLPEKNFEALLQKKKIS